MNLGPFDFESPGFATTIKHQELADKWKTLEGNQIPKRLLAVLAEVWGGSVSFLQYALVLFYFILFYFCFLGLHLQHMELPRLGRESEL